MGSLQRRLGSVESRLAGMSAQQPEEPASVRWLAILKIFLPVLEREERTPESEAALERMRYSIALLEEYAAGDLRASPWAYLEYYCHGCLLRLGWNTPGWEGRQLAFLEPDYDDRIRQIEAIERGRRGPGQSSSLNPNG
jgi:hypothetical protein